MQNHTLECLTLYSVASVENGVQKIVALLDTIIDGFEVGQWL